MLGYDCVTTRAGSVTVVIPFVTIPNGVGATRKRPEEWMDKTKKSERMKDQSDTEATANGRFTRLNLFLCALLITGALVAGCGTTGRQQPAENTLRPFDAEKVAKLSHEAYNVAWDAQFWARRDLRFAAFEPTALDRETVEYLDRITRQVPWVAREIEKHPATPRLSSKRSYSFVRFDAMMLKTRYQPASFKSSTDIKIEKLLRILDEIESYYEEWHETK